MLSRVHDTRVFSGSHDVVYSATSECDAQQRLARITADARSRRAQRNEQQQLVDSAANAASSDDDDLLSDNNSDSSDAAFEYFRDSRHPPSTQLHPQHPYNAQLVGATAHRTSRSRDSRSRSRQQQQPHAPMEFVLLPSGEIRPRDECPLGLALPPPVTTTATVASRLLGADGASDSDEHQHQHQHQQQQHRRVATQSDTRAPLQHRRIARLSDSSAAGAFESSLDDRFATPRTTHATTKTTTTTTNRIRSQRLGQRASNRSSERDDDASSDSDSSATETVQQQHEASAAAAVGTRRGRDARAAQTTQRHATAGSSDRNAQLRPSAAAAAARTRSTTHHHSVSKHQQHNNSNNSNDSNDSDDDSAPEQLQPPRRRAASPTRQAPAKAKGVTTKTTKARQQASSSSSASDDSRSAAWQREYTTDRHSPPPTTTAVPAGDNSRSHRRAAKLDVRDLLSEHAHVRLRPPKARTRALRADAAPTASVTVAPPDTRAPTAAISDTEAPAPVHPDTVIHTTPDTGATTSLDTAAQLEQVTQQLQREKQRVLDKMTQLLAEQSKSQQLQHDVAAAQTASSTAAAQVHVLELQLRERDAEAAQLRAECAAATAALQQQQQQLKSGNPVSDGPTSDQQQLERIVATLRKFRLRVARWQQRSAVALDTCTCRTDSVGLVDSLWRDFPAFPLRDVLDAEPSESEIASDGHSDTLHMLQFLTKRLRLRDDELSQTHNKYTELKELCARQCVREADLQNFINEHRLRGNLVIRKDDVGAPNNDGGVVGTVSEGQRRTVQFDEQQQQQRKSVTRATNTPPVYFDDNVDDVEGVSDGHDDGDTDADAHDDDDDEVDDDGVDDYGQRGTELYVREPRVFVQVGRDGVFEHARSANATAANTTMRRSRNNDVERIRLVPPPALARRLERNAAPVRDLHASRRKAGASGPSLTRPNGASVRGSMRQLPVAASARTTASSVRRKGAVTATSATQRPRTGASVSSRIARASAAPWV